MSRLHASRGSHFILPLAPHLSPAAVRARIPAALRPALHLLPPGNTFAALAHARLALVASGTATVETALFGVPLIVFYKLSGLSYQIGRRLVRLRHVAMVNLLAGSALAPELIQSAFTPAAVVAWAERLLPPGPERTAMLAGLERVQSTLGGGGAIARAADAVAETLALPRT